MTTTGERLIERRTAEPRPRAARGRAGSAAAARLAAVALAACLLIGCGGADLALPSLDVPTFDTAAVERLLQDAIEEVDRLAASPPPVDVPADVADLLERVGVDIPPLPSNAAEICDTLGTPGLAGVAGAGLGTVLESFAAGSEVGLVAALLVTVVFSTCPVWSPHLETALGELL